MTKGNVELLDLEGSRRLEVRVDGDDSLKTLLFCHDTPGAAVGFPLLETAAADAGFRLVSWSRPGYGRSTTQRNRSIRSTADDARAVCSHLNLEQFSVAGWSGGGPHALSIAAMVPLCTEVLLLSGFGPATVPDLDFLTGMNDSVIEEFTLAFEGEGEFEEALIDAAEELQTVTREGLTEVLGGDLRERDQLALFGPLGDVLVKSFQHAVMKTSAGWRDDDSALVRNWGFSLDHVRVPVTVAIGGADTRVPPSHGEWLASHLPHATVQVLNDAGHVSILEHLGELLSAMAKNR